MLLNVMPTQNESYLDLFNEINHISLNHGDLFETFEEYKNRDVYVNYKILNKHLINALLNYNTVVELCVISCRESVMFGMLTITLAEELNDKVFSDMYKECTNLNLKNDLLNQSIENLKKLNIPLSVNELKSEFLDFIKNFQKEIYSTILSKNKDILSYTKLNKHILNNRKEIYFNHLDIDYL